MDEYHKKCSTFMHFSSPKDNYLPTVTQRLNTKVMPK